ncbi:carboxypeptidase-like regulatory domain-containing protein [Chitinophaga qingshengii]|uniref:Carboxypeptidase regulatory-like domain-containing protein n=1 Tax=Chitinophaga qingshengii TaxID=1569794 RepID=A0ABR7TUM3_9BACT|nr:carboxypeptidase-like regulatory domain-containing protein [Chitinophaga qingshengii]MBC9933131.1 hypothetical protein [Chitinophaga qingshengii]
MSSISKLFVLACFVLLYHVNGQAQTKMAYSKLLYNGKEYNELIVDRFPQYGFAGKDGCVVQGQLVLELKDTGAQEVEGLVKDAETGAVIFAATVQLKRANGTTEEIATDEQGKFLVHKGSYVKTLRIAYIGYRLLNIKAASGKLF